MDQARLVFKLVVLVIVLGCWTPRLFARTVQELGLPSPVAFEAVLPQIVFGTTVLKVESEVVVVNGTDKEAYVEFQLFDPDGEPAEVRVVDRDGHTRTIEGSERNLLPRSVHKFLLPGTGYDLVGENFVGWGKVRSNQKVTAFSTLKYLDSDSGELSVGPHGSEVSLFGNEEGVQKALVPVRFSTTETGMPIKRTGIAVLNLLDAEISVELKLLDDDGLPVESEQMPLEAKSQKAVFVDEIFELSDSFTGGIELASPPGSPFSFSCLQFQSGLDPLIEVPVFVLGETPWDFPVQILEEVEVGEYEVLLTRFGFYLNNMAGQNLAYYQINRGYSLTSSPEASIVVVEGGGIPLRASTPEFFPYFNWREKGVLFLETRNVVYLRMGGAVRDILYFPDEKLIEIYSGAPCLALGTFPCGYSWWIALIDKSQEEVLEVHHTGGVEDHLPVPPWRD